MASVNLLNVEILNGEQLPFSSTFRFQITFECVAEISDDLVRAAPPPRRGALRALTPPPPHPPSPCRTGA